MEGKSQETGQSRVSACPMFAVTCKGSFLSLAPSLWSYDRSYSCEQNISPALTSPHLKCILYHSWNLPGYPFSSLNPV